MVRRGVYARHRLDISVGDTLLAILSCGWRSRREKLEVEVLAVSWKMRGRLFCGVEWICDWVRRVIRPRIQSRQAPPGHDPHNTSALPSNSCRYRRQDACAAPWMLEEAPATAAGVLIAHLFGGEWISVLCPGLRGARLLLVEACAQAFRGRRGWETRRRLHVQFGTLQTSTQSAARCCRSDAETLGRMRKVQASYPPQGRGGYSKKLLGILGIVVVSRPLPTVWSASLRAADMNSTHWWAMVPGFLPGSRLRRSSNDSWGGPLDRCSRCSIGG